MNLHTLIQDVVRDTVGPSLAAFQPELAVCATIVVLLVVRMIRPLGWFSPFWILLIGSSAAFFLTKPWLLLCPEHTSHSTAIFTGMLVHDSFAVYMRAIVLLFVMLFAVLTRLTGVPGRSDATDLYALVLGATLGMCLMVSANHMLVVFLGVEMASVPSYVLAGMRKEDRKGSEAALKYAVYGAGAAGVMLYGISLLCGALGSAHLPTMATQLAAMLQQGIGDRSMILMLGGLMVMVGLAFKLSAVPFHFWTPDVFEGAPAEIGAFLSVASKAAALALLVRLALGFGFTADPTMLAALEPARNYICGLVALLAAVTCTFGNLAAYGQTNMKRLLAYSTIAHAGYMMMAVVAAVALAGKDPQGARWAVAALVFYATIYLFMNLGAFAFVAFVRNRLHSENVADYAGLIRRSPGLALCVAAILFSLVGLPPLAGFAGKFAIFAALFDARQLTLLAIGGLNTVLSLFYYLRVVKVMTLDAEPAERPAPTIPMWSAPGAYCLVVTLPVVVFLVWWQPLLAWAVAATSNLM